jgi:hypothetical protein
LNEGVDEIMDCIKDWVSGGTQDKTIEKNE